MLRAGGRAAGDRGARRSSRGGRLRRQRRRLDEALGARRPRGARAPDDDRRASSAAIRWPAPRRRASSTPRADLFEGARWYLTPTERHERHALRAPLPGWSPALGARPDGDRAPTPRPPDGDGQPPAARARERARQPGGARAGRGGPAAARRPARASATRPGWPGANPPLWRDIFLANREAIDARARDACIAALARGAARTCARATPAASSAGSRRSRADRRRLLEAELAGGPVSEVRVAVPNRPGIVAQLALALGEAGVNIVDMALYPAPDMRSGAIALWVAGEGSAERVVELVGGARVPASRSPTAGAVRFEPAHRLAGTLTPPPDKSISHRAALIARDERRGRARDSRTTCASDDTPSTLEAVTRGSGARVGGPIAARAPTSSWRRRPARRRARRRIDVGNAGTLLRLLPGLARGPARRQLDARRRREHPAPPGRPRRRSRCARWARSVECRDGRLPPLTVDGRRPARDPYELPVASAQVKSCVLLAGLLAEGETTVVEPLPTRDHTERMLRRRGRDVSSASGRR